MDGYNIVVTDKVFTWDMLDVYIENYLSSTAINFSNI